MADWIGSEKKGMLGWPDLAWRNYSQGSFHQLTTASGVVTATLVTTSQILKAVWVQDGGLNGAATINLDGAVALTYGSGGLTGWNPCWLKSGGAITITTATAQALGFLIGTGLPPFEF
jgi:hypothetical protein